MPKFVLGMAIGVFVLSGCAAQSPDRDAVADAQLGLVAEEEQVLVHQALEEIKKTAIDDRKRQLDRQITDPAFEQEEDN